MVSEILEFKGTWRTYQARVLKNADKYLKDKKIHIVAAPGSGKTTLGIEIMKRVGENALVFAPSVTIREQWVERIKDAFLKEGLVPEEYLSQNLREPKSITVVTYQALHSAMNKYNGKLKEEKEDEGDDKVEVREEEVDFADFDIIETMKSANVKVLCLDECHHLRSEWWKALEEFKRKYEDDSITTIALTATPPYDSTPAMWDRYMKICGDIDEEITIPELVKEGSLCPHQDFVYFNYPTQLEKDTVKKFEEKSEAFTKKMMEDAAFFEEIKSHKALNGKVNEEELLDTPYYLSSMLIYLNEKGVQFPDKLKKLLGTSNIPGMEEKWMEYLLQGFIYDDKNSYRENEEYREKLIASLKAEGLMENRKVCLITNAKLEKMLAQSKGKCESIKEIVFNEYEDMGRELRLLILTDFIRKEYEKAIGNIQEDVTNIGVIPFFEMLRRENLARGKNVRFGVLCGTIVIIPASAKELLLNVLNEGETVTFSNVGTLSEEEYVCVSAPSTSHFLTGAITDVFTKGGMEVLIGTKSLLGEGWDSPCINSLILASFVGSFMLSNQMRGRAIRVFKENKDKTSNIWHLVCLKTTKEAKKDISEDYQLLKRRMEHFLGIHYENETIENGMERLSIIQEPFDEANVTVMNAKMLEHSRQRDILKQRWEAALKNFDKMEVSEQVNVKESLINTTALDKVMKSGITKGILTVAMGAMCVASGGIFGVACGVAAGAFAIGAGKAVTKIKKFLKPEGRLKGYGEGILTALKKLELLENNRCQVEIDAGKNDENELYLKGGSGRDKALFAKCVEELFGQVDNQRYLLVRKGNKKGLNGFYCVPECFGKRKEDAECFYECMREYMGEYYLVYTRNEQGRKVLLEGRKKALANRKEQIIHRQKVKSALE